jgi:hypothetical protein
MPPLELNADLDAACRLALPIPSRWSVLQAAEARSCTGCRASYRQGVRVVDVVPGCPAHSRPMTAGDVARGLETPGAGAGREEIVGQLQGEGARRRGPGAPGGHPAGHRLSPRQAPAPVRTSPMQGELRP